MYYLAVLFPLWGMPLLPSSTTFFFFLPHILGIRFFFFLVLISFSQLHPSFHTLYTPLLLFLFSLLLFLSSSMLLGIDCTTRFLLVSQKEIFVLNFCESVPSCLCILHSSHMLPPFSLLSILSLAGVCLWRAYSPLHNIPAPFPIWDMLAFFLAMSFMVWPYALSLPLFNLNIWVFLFEIASSPISKTFHFFYHFLFPHFYLFSHSTLHYSTYYYFKFILENQPPLFFFFFISAVMG